MFRRALLALLTPLLLAMPGASAAQEASPVAGSMGGELLVEVTIPADLVPHGEGRNAFLLPITVRSGSVGRWAGEEGMRSPGLRLTYVLSGRLALQVEGPGHPGQLVPAGHPAEAVMADATLALEPGDAWISRTETGFGFENPGTEPTVLVSWILSEPTTFVAPFPAGWQFHHDYSVHTVSVPPGAVTLRLHRVTVAPGDSLPAPGAGRFQFAVALPTNAAGTPVVSILGTTSDGAIQNLGREAITLYVLTMGPAAASDEVTARAPQPRRANPVTSVARTATAPSASAVP